MIDGQNMNVVTSSKDRSIPQNQPTIYPNFTTDIIRIMGINSPADIAMSDMNGTVIIVFKSVDSMIHIGDMPAGIYILDIKNKEVRERHKVIRVQ